MVWILASYNVYTAPLNFQHRDNQNKLWIKTEVLEETEGIPDHILNQLKSDPFIKKHFGWKLAFCQHPMYLLIDEDRGKPTVGERIPPWGARNKEGYVERVRRNLKSLEELSELKLNYQWGAGHPGKLSPARLLVL